MSAPLSMESAVGYVAAEDVYVVYREYYGDGTIYGRADLLLNGEPVKGAGKSKKELVEAGVLVSENVIGSIGGDLVGVPDSNEPAPEPLPEAFSPVGESAEVAEVVAEVAAEVVAEVVAEVAAEVAAEVVAEVVAEVAAEVVAEVAEVTPACACACGPACACACACAPECACVAPLPEPVPVCCSGRYTVSLNIAGFTVSRELNVKINEESRQIYLSD
jgi:hypothetical protein